MTTANLKINLINKITLIQDSSVIKEIQRVLDFELNEGIFELNSAQKKRITDAKSEIKQKKVLSHTSANSMVTN